MKIFVTGSAGFIGFHLARALLAAGHDILGYDALTDYYDVRLKRARHDLLHAEPRFGVVIGRLEDAALLHRTVAGFAPEIVLHLAGQAGVRHSIEQPGAYVSSNLVGTLNLLEALRLAPVRHALLASSSSIYGADPGPAFAEAARTDFPLSVYAATKHGTESLAHAYAHLFGIPTTMLRFFTVYGPWGRPDMAAIRFATAIVEGRPIDIYGNGEQSRDFTYIGDVVAAVLRLIGTVPTAGQPLTPADSLSPAAPWRTVNVAGGRPLPLMQFIAALERALGTPATKRFLPMQPGDVAATRADPSLLATLIGVVPSTSLDVGIAAFVDWFRTDWQAIRAQA